MSIRKIFLPPVHDDFERTQKATFLHFALIIVAFALLAFGFLNLGWGANMLGSTLILFSGICILGFILNKYKYYFPAATILTTIIFIAIYYNLIDGAALHDPGVAAIPIFILLAGLLFERKMIPIHTLISLLGTVGIYYFWEIGILELSQAPTENRVIVLAILQLVTGYLSWVILSTYRKTIDRLDRSEERYRSLFDNVPIGLFRTTPEGQILDANQAFIKMFRYPSREAILETNAADLYVDSDDRQIIKAVLDKDSLVQAGTVQHRRYDGKGFWAEFHTRSIQDVNDQILFEGATLDITERKQTEDILRESAEKYRVFVDKSTAIIYNYEIHPPMPLGLPVEEQIDWLLHKSKLVEANEAYTQAIGVQSIDEFLGTTIMDAWGGDDTYGKDILRDFIERDYIFDDYETPETDVYGTKIWAIHNTFSVIENDHLLRLWGTAIDITKRKEVEQDLAESEARYRNLVENIDDLIYRYEFMPERGFSYVSSSAEKMTGYTPEEHYADPDLGFKLIHPDDRHLLDEISTGENEPTQSITLRWKKKDGAVIWTEQRNTYIYDDDGNLITIEGIARDITERKQAELALVQSENDLNKAQAIARIGSYFWDLETDRVVWSDEMKRLLWFQDEEPSYEFFLSRIHPDDKENVIAQGQQIQASAEPAELEYRIIGPDGTIRWMRDRIIVNSDDEGNPFRMRGTSQDITGRKKVEAALAESEAMFRGFAELSFQGIYLYTFYPPISTDLPIDDQVAAIYRDGRRVWCNDYFAQMYGRDREDLIGGTLYDTHGSDEVPENLTWIKEWVRSGFRTIEALSTETDQDGNQLWISNNVIGIIKDGALVEAWGTQMDVTDRRQAEMLLKESSDRLKLALQAAKMGTWEWDIQENRVAWSPETLDIFGVTESEFGGTYEAYLDFAAPGVRDEVNEGVQNFLSNAHKSAEIQYEHQIIRGDGKQGWIEVRGSVFLDVEGKPLRMTGICADISERKEAENELRESEVKIRAFFEHSNVPIGVAKGGVHAMANTAYLDMFGFDSFEELENTPLLEKIAPSERDRIGEFVKLREKGETVPDNYQTTGLRSDGTEFPIEVFVTQYEIDGEAFTSAFFTDLTEQKQAEEALLDSETKLSAIFDHHFQMTGLLDLEGRIIAANKGAFDFSGISEQDFLGLIFWEGPMWDPSQESEIRSAFDRAANGEFVRYETTNINKDGEVRNIDFSLSPVEDDDGKVVYIVPEGRDITKRKRSENALKASEERFRAAASAMSDLVWESDHESDTLVWFGDVDSALGYKKGEFPRTVEGWMAAIHPDDREKVNAIYDKTLESGDDFFAEYRIQKKDGSILYWEDHGITAEIRDGNVVRSVGAVTDITERKQAEEALRQSEAHYRTLFESARDSIFIMDGEIIIDANPATLEMFGVELDDIVGKTPFDLSPEFQSDGRLSKEFGVPDFSSENNFEWEIFEWIHERSDGSTFDAEVSLNLIELKGKKHTLSIVRDISERKHAELALQASEERYRNIVEDFPGYINRWLPDGIRTYVNEQYCQDYGLTEEQALGTSIFPGYDKSELEELQSRLATLSESNPVTTGVYKRIKPDGSEGWTRWTDRAIYDVIGELTEYQSVGFDITDQRKAFQAVQNERQRLARELHDAVSQTLFSANVIAQTLDRLWEQNPNMVRQNLGELQKLTQGALAEMRTLLLELRPAALENTSMTDLLQQLTDGFIGRTQTALDLSITGRDPLPFKVRATYFRIAQEALNNIIKHARAKKVGVSYSSQDGGAKLTIKDNGLGFDVASQQTGQHGMSIMRERAESIAAKLQITSNPEEGTRIEIEWKGPKGQ